MTTYLVMHRAGDTAPNAWLIVATDDNGRQRLVSRYSTRAEAEEKLEMLATMAAAEPDIVAP
jgi:hypothetical protein